MRLRKSEFRGVDRVCRLLHENMEINLMIYRTSWRLRKYGLDATGHGGIVRKIETTLYRRSYVDSEYLRVFVQNLAVPFRQIYVFWTLTIISPLTVHSCD